MKKLLLLALALLLAFPCGNALAEGQDQRRQDLKQAMEAMPNNRIEQLTGEAWLNSEEDAKIAVLFGVELAIDIERAIDASMQRGDQKAGKRAKARQSNLSPFENGWHKAFSGVALGDIAKQIDGWYVAHPDQKKRLVMDVIWFELVQPRLGK